MFLFSRHFWMLHRVSLEHKFPNGAPLWIRFLSPIFWVLFYLAAFLVKWFKQLQVKLFGPYPNRKHLLALNHEAIVSRGGDSYGDHALLKCSKCGTPFLIDGEHDYFYPKKNGVKRTGSGCN